MGSLASNTDNAGNFCVAEEEEEEAGRTPLLMATEAMFCFTPRNPVFTGQEERCFDKDGELE